MPDANFNVLKYGAGDNTPTADSPGPPDRGVQFFVGGPANAASSATQVVDLTERYGAAVDRGGVTFRLAGYLGWANTQGDAAALTAVFQSAAGAALGTVRL